jgi:hypothetical protein
MVLCPSRRSVTTLQCVLLKDGSLIFAVGLGPEMSCCMQLFVGILSYKNFETTVVLLDVRTNEITLHMCCETVWHFGSE